MADISPRWACEFRNNPQANKLTQGIECSVDSLCSHPAQENPLTYTDLKDFLIEFRSKTVSYVASTRWFPDVRERIKTKLKAEGKKDDTEKFESDSRHLYKIREVLFSTSEDAAIPKIMTIIYVDEEQQQSFIFLIGNGKRAIISQPISIFDHLSVVHYFGSCHPQ
jgi:hypothetical protein